MQLRAFSVPWFIGEPYELLTLPFLKLSLLVDYHVLFNIPDGLAATINWVPYYQPDDYDFAILHLDIDCIDPRLPNCRKRQLYLELDEIIQEIPKVVIVHGTPRSPLHLDREEARRRLNGLVRGNHVVVASEANMRFWGRGDVIVPGMITDEWLDLAKEPRIVTAVPLDGLPRASYEFLEAVRIGLAANDVILCHIGINYIPANNETRRDYLASSLIYLAPKTNYAYQEDILRAMLCGCCVISGPHPVGEDALPVRSNCVMAAEDAPQAVALATQLLNNPERAIRMGKECKMNARQLLDWGRYLRDWETHLSRILGNHV